MAKIKSKRWMKTDIFLENGKAFVESKTEIDVYFRNKDSVERENIITFRIQPDEGIRIKFFVKIPGIDINITPKTLKFKYSDSLDLIHTPNDYERLIHDAFVGDQTLFASTKEIMASWRFVTSITKIWDSVPVIQYEKGIKSIE
jgi:glucose-6-phosphate 1-dehydrogenase